ncbi:PTS system cellobiose-specific transporter subunit IIB [Klebsiella pneumoniae]|uniref:PTS sugar transporter subunit IIB n=2 Tax=Klebsiella pneumoniae TaxID=573 RepID=UPI00077FDB7B|nr:PTS sugar transporter subunit IIB [Klebsiella pneumoniae]ARX37971.1 PTS sugar transporter subunit IIB [Klebsiella pneumoniae]EIX9448879.1 PTS sugar transporter subunit IIB [Klebsiella pneumoniae]EIX9489474.1 PTS sugar transporter subunit IIB [Klebsiella pneumoniae]ELB7835112.1 PTS sugar transporter subunit IIB [Klebsiella pneumoniae]ELW9383204.1 PTS sugar transporter subunit IIB [Klebsiella pneumoniae]
MKKIFLCCAAGMSTSMVMNKMKQAAAAQGIAVDIIAVSMDDFDRTLPNYDCCLLGPQIKYKFEEFNKKAAAVGKRVAVIDSMDYGMMRGDKILAVALALLDEPSLNK